MTQAAEYPWRFVCHGEDCTFIEVQQLTDTAAVKIIKAMALGLVATTHNHSQKFPCGPVTLEPVKGSPA